MSWNESECDFGMGLRNGVLGSYRAPVPAWHFGLAHWGDSSGWGRAPALGHAGLGFPGLGFGPGAGWAWAGASGWLSGQAGILGRGFGLVLWGGALKWGFEMGLRSGAPGPGRAWVGAPVQGRVPAWQPSPGPGLAPPCEPDPLARPHPAVVPKHPKQTLAWPRPKPKSPFLLLCSLIVTLRKVKSNFNNGVGCLLRPDAR